MSVKAGLDFGTTTSIFSYMEGDELKTFKYGGETGGGEIYVPTAVAYDDNEINIGQYAVSGMSEEARLFRYFKMQLPLETRDINPLPEALTADFIGELIRGRSPSRELLPALEKINEFAFEPFSDRRVESLVVSVPEVWKDATAHGRQKLQQVIREVLQLPLVQLISEPVAAAAYFSHIYKKKKSESFQGNLLVCDMGGGSFDVTLCRMRDKRVQVLFNDGNGKNGLGIAGMHFDRRIIENCFGGALDVKTLDAQLFDLDRQKKSPGSQKRLAEQMKGKNLLAPIYTLRCKEEPAYVKINEIRAAFETVKTEISDVLTRITGAARQKNEPVDKVILVGGFSRFPLVQQAIGEFFGEDISAGGKLIDLKIFKPDEIAFAISFGASLIANEVIDVTEKYEYTVGIVVTTAGGEDIELELIKAGGNLEKLSETKFCLRENGQERAFGVKSRTIEPEIFIRLADEQKITRRLSLPNIPNFHEKNRWHIGARVDFSKIPFLVIRDEQKNEEKEYPLSDLIPEIIAEN